MKWRRRSRCRGKKLPRSCKGGLHPSTGEGAAFTVNKLRINLPGTRSGGAGVDRSGGAKPRSEDYGGRGSSVKKGFLGGLWRFLSGAPVLPLLNLLTVPAFPLTKTGAGRGRHRGRLCRSVPDGSPPPPAARRRGPEYGRRFLWWKAGGRSQWRYGPPGPAAYQAG